MSKISINQTISTNHISTINNSLEALNIQHTISLANRTTIGGNNKAHEIINIEKTVVRSFIAALQSDIEILRKTAVKFEQTDYNISRDFANNYCVEESSYGPRIK